jgi:protein-disulfide isomerase
LACLALAESALALSAAVLNYQGRIAVSGANFTGEGLFVFSIEDANGALLWASGEFPLAGTANLPPGVIRVPVKDGLYKVRLGDTAAGMRLLDAAILHAASNPLLRVWFNDGKRGWLRAAGETRLKSRAAAAPSGSAAVSGVQRDVLTGAVPQERQEPRRMIQQPQGPAAAPPQVAPVALTTSRIVTVSLPDASPSLGRDDAPLVLVEFVDFQCPYCKQAQENVLPQLKKKYVETGKLRIISRNLPLLFHPNAEAAAQAAFCAHQQGQFWPMRDWLFANTAAYDTTNFLRAAKGLNLDLARLTRCLDLKSAAAQIARDKQDAEAAGITATPSFVLGRPAAGKVTGPLLAGARPLADFDAEIEYILSPPAPELARASTSGPRPPVASPRPAAARAPENLLK